MTGYETSISDLLKVYMDELSVFPKQHKLDIFKTGVKQ